MAKDSYRVEPPSRSDDDHRSGAAEPAPEIEAHPAPIADRVDDASPPDEPQPCGKCGYDLRGLPDDARCPECGQARRERNRSPFLEPLSMMPMDVIRTMQRATAIGLVAVIAALVLVVAGLFSVSPTAQTMWLIAALAWCVGAWALTPALEIREGILRGFGEQGGLRRAARHLQLAWVAVAVLAMLPQLFIALNPPASQIWLLLQLLFIAVGIGGVVVWGLIMEQLAEWTRDDLAERLFNIGEWMFAITSGIVILAVLFQAFAPGSAVAVLLRFFGIIASVGLVAAIGALLVALASLTRSASLSVTHAIEYQERMQRRQKRKQQEHRKMPAPAE